MQTGIILLWHGAIVDIPPGFVLCDGNNGTPDLRDKFVVGAGDSYAPADTGGSVNHNHDFTGDGHTHDLVAGVFLTGGTAYDNTSSVTAVTGTTDNESSLPPYYALAFIMKT